ncbi:uncharacterized protein FFNC_15537 [Fusarium fujikuroi]|nr:uncharacterized protein FFNC_15537 [Fusarium fujikuroi]
MDSSDTNLKYRVVFPQKALIDIEKKQFHLATDASENGAGGGRFNDAECRYTILEKEMLAVVRGFNESDCMINHSSHPVKVYTDHKGITDSMANREHLQGKISRWIEILAKHGIEYTIFGCHIQLLRKTVDTTKVDYIASQMEALEDLAGRLEYDRRLSKAQQAFITSITSGGSNGPYWSWFFELKCAVAVVEWGCECCIVGIEGYRGVKEGK